MKKLLELQKAINPIKKDADNTYHNCKYFDINKLLEVLKPELNKLGLILSQPLTHINGRPAIGTVIVDAETGISIINEAMPLPDLDNPQKMGSCITYYRRYSLQSALGLEAEDDDANLASKPYSKPKTVKSEPARQGVTGTKLYVDSYDGRNQLSKMGGSYDEVNKVWAISDSKVNRELLRNFPYFIKGVKDGHGNAVDYKATKQEAPTPEPPQGDTNVPKSDEIPLPDFTPGIN